MGECCLLCKIKKHKYFFRVKLVLGELGCNPCAVLLISFITHVGNSRNAVLSFRGTSYLSQCREGSVYFDQHYERIYGINVNVIVVVNNKDAGYVLHVFPGYVWNSWQQVWMRITNTNAQTETLEVCKLSVCEHLRSRSCVTRNARNTTTAFF